MKWAPWMVMGMLGTTLLAGCSISGEDELRQWMSEQRNQVHPRVIPLTEPKKFIPQAYTQDDVRFAEILR